MALKDGLAQQIRVQCPVAFPLGLRNLERRLGPFLIALEVSEGDGLRQEGNGAGRADASREQCSLGYESRYTSQ
jgi:hypothetical protein